MCAVAKRLPNCPYGEVLEAEGEEVGGAGPV